MYFKSVFNSWQLHYYNYLIENFVQLINYFGIPRLKSYKCLEVTAPTSMVEHVNSSPNNERLREKKVENIDLQYTYTYTYAYTHTSSHKHAHHAYTRPF